MSVAHARSGALVSIAVLVLGTAGAALGPSGAAHASPAQNAVVSAVPAASTPNIENGTVYAITAVGSTVVVGGSFTSVTAHGASTAVTRNRVLAFDATSGALSDAFAPSLDGTVNTVQPGPVAGTVYAGGAFTDVGSVKSKGLALLDLASGALVSGFKAPSFNGAVQDVRLAGGHLLVVGSFTVVGGQTHQGIVSLDPATGAVDGYTATQLTGHHNYAGSGASGPVGGRALDVSPDGTRAVVVGNFKNADGVPHDQIVLLDLSSTSAAVDPGWNTLQYTAPCASNAFDTYVEDVDFAPDGSYFSVAATGGSTFSTNTDGTRGLCDSATRWETAGAGSNVQPTWVDYTGNDTFWSVASTGTAVYVGGHQRWVNNPLGGDSAGPGAVPRPGVVALDPVNGLPYSWNPGRNPRGAGAYALLATADGLYVGSDTSYIGNYRYKRARIAYFPLAGGSTPPSTATAQLPADLYSAGPFTTAAGTPTTGLGRRPVSSTRIGDQTTVAGTGIDWSATRGAFVAGGTLFWGGTDGSFYRAPFYGTSIGAPTAIDPYNDPAWSAVDTGSGQTYRGARPGYYGELASITGQFFRQGRVYYTLAGQSGLYWRWFEPESGVVSQVENVATGSGFSAVAGLIASGDTLYYASSADGILHSMSFSGGVPDPSTDTSVTAPGIDWRARSLFLFGGPTFPDQPGPAVVFDGNADWTGSSAAPTVTTPGGVRAGDTELLIVSANAAGITGTPAGWTPLRTVTNSTLETTLFTRTATSGDAGTAVTVPLGATARVDVQLAAYAGVSSVTPTSTTDVATGTHTAPGTTVGTAGAWVVSYWADRSSTTTSWTLPATLTARQIAVGTGTSRVSAALADSGGAATTGAYPAQVATTDAPGSRGVGLTVLLAP